ncbi:MULTISPECIES: 50S ribosomal protein P1 [Haloarcula]|uniref:50S ribosomal protein P1 n=1 Tax=Haloarcula TaxID=2237 RepID=UPI0023ED4849|nr:50S ribosomal protein P1 [Halomicroarcula sp. XH51]
MEYVYAALMLHETGTEINEQNLTATVEAAGGDPEASRIKAIVAALEDVDLSATEAATTESAGMDLALERDDSDDGSDTERDESDRLDALFDVENDAESGGLEDEDDSLEGGARPSDPDGEAEESSDEPEA